MKEERLEVLKISPEMLRERRKELGLSATKLGNLIGVSPSWVSAVERGKKNLLSSPYLRVKLYLEALGLED